METPIRHCEFIIASKSHAAKSVAAEVTVGVATAENETILSDSRLSLKDFIYLVKTSRDTFHVGNNVECGNEASGLVL